MRIGGRLLLLGLLLTLGACTRWTVVRQAAPNPFVGQTKFFVEPVDYGQISAAPREGDSAKRFESDKERVAQTYLGELREEADELQFVGEPSDDTVTIRSSITSMDGGVSMGITSTAAEINMTVQLVKGGEVLDEIALSAEASQSEGVSIGGVATSGYSGSDRLHQAAEKLAGYVAAYLEERTSGG